MKALRIVDWAEYYETAESKRLVYLTWVATPNGHDSLGYCEILAHPNGMAHYGAWNLILQIASKCPTRGLLVSGRGKAHDARSIALVTRASEKIVAEAIPRLLHVEWLEEIELQEHPGDIRGTAGGPLGVAGDLQGYSTRVGRTEQNTGGEHRADAPPPPGTELLIQALKAIRAAGAKPDERDALEEWISLTTNDCGCQDDAEAAEAVKQLARSAQKNGVKVRYARNAEAFAQGVKDILAFSRARRPA